MSDDEQVDYFRKRAAAERELARIAPTNSIGRIHTQMAAHYESLIESPVRRDELQIVGDPLGPTGNGAGNCGRSPSPHT